MFPLAGNGGYDVSNYSLTLDYTPSANRLVGTAVITARATQNLSRFDLDFRMQGSVTRLLVNGADASFAYADGQELVITPASGLVQGKTLTGYHAGDPCGSFTTNAPSSVGTQPSIDWSGSVTTTGCPA